MLDYAILIPALPLLAVVVLQFFEGRLGKRAANVAIGAITLSFLLSVAVLLQAVAYNATHEAHGMIMHREMRWITLNNVDISLGIMVDNLTAVMLIVVTLVGLAIQVYSLGYMHDEPLFGRYYRYLSLFTFSMLSLVLADNLFQAFIFWELVGVCSYLLIGFWFKKDGPQYAQKKAFLVTKFGDLGFLVGVTVVFFVFGTFSFEGIFGRVPEIARFAFTDVLWGLTGTGLITVIALLIFLGAMGKSAQFPLHIWLPNAMEGPTPVSALIHAATMVAAGVYLVGRMYPLFAASHVASLVVAVIGAITLLMAATIALTVNDIKGVLAYSTISQLGYMMLGLGAGSLTAGIFHLMTHAFFKALLFLGAGSVIHAAHTHDLREMGGLRKHLPRTFWTFAIATLAIAGIPPLSGFWSKDEILLAAFHFSTPLFIVALLGAGLTACYMSRLVFLCFFGSSRKAKRHDVGHAGPIHESPWSMTYPMMALAGLSIVAGLVGAPLPLVGNLFGEFIRYGAEHPEPSLALMALSVLAACAGISVAYLAYVRKAFSPAAVSRALGPLHALVSRKYFIDEFVDLVAVKGSLLVGRCLAWLDRTVVDGAVNLAGRCGRQLSKASGAFDLAVVDGAVNLSGAATRLASNASGVFDLAVVDGAVNLSARLTGGAGAVLRTTQTGKVQTYVAMVFAGLLCLFVMLLALGAVF